ncbi:MAG: acyl-protein synthetase [Bacillaceae bacterium]|nr:acyl-protein synthetase [Bacillaceae bacterium]
MNDLFNAPFQMNKVKKSQFFLPEIQELTNYHAKHCEPYKNILDHLSLQTSFVSLEDVPYLPVQMFKMLDLYSINYENIFKTLTSSGTTGQRVSKIYIDKHTALLQSKALISIVTSFIGKKRLPMIIIDSKSVLKDRKAFSARGAGIVGFSNFGRNHFYLLNEQMEIDWDGLEAFIKKYEGQPILLFGFTFMIWQYFYKKFKVKQTKLNLKNSILIHGGGWKKLQEEAISNWEFKGLLKEQLGIDRVHNYYGMVEQVGSIFMECEYGHLHTPIYADVIIRDISNYQALPMGEKGLIQVISLLPKSYPGHSILTEDIGMLLGEDDCPCGRYGKYFAVEGRIPKAEVRGCSDTHAYR